MGFIKNRIIWFLLISAIFCAGATGTKDAGWKFIKTKSLLTDSVRITELNAATVIKFGADTVKISENSATRQFPASEFSSFELLQECRSPLKIEVAADSLAEYPLQDLYVTLSGDELEYLGVLEKSDEGGLALFPNIPYGEYKALIVDPSGIFFPKEVRKITHVYDDTFPVVMQENVLVPEEISCNLILQPDDRYCAELKWWMDKDSIYGPFRDYVFHMVLNDEWIGETSETNFYIDDLEPGHYVVGVLSRSWYGNSAEDYKEIIFDIEEETPETATVDRLEDLGTEEATYTYYDLNGTPLGKAPTVSGLYIRSDGRIFTKILIP